MQGATGAGPHTRPRPRHKPRMRKRRGHREEAEARPERPGADGREGGGSQGRSHRSGAGSQVSAPGLGRAGWTLELRQESCTGCSGVGRASQGNVGNLARVRSSLPRPEAGRGSGAAGEWSCQPGPGFGEQDEGGPRLRFKSWPHPPSRCVTLD